MPLDKGVSMETKFQGCPKNAGLENSSKCCSFFVYVYEKSPFSVWNAIIPLLLAMSV